MIIYNKLWLRNKRIVDLLNTDKNAGLITNEEFIKIKASHPVGFYLPGVVIRVGLFILTLIIAIVTTGFLSLLASELHAVESPGWPIALGIICCVFLEFIVRERNYFHSGVDNALLYFTASLLAGGFIWMVYNMHINQFHNLLSSVIIFGICLYLTLRFADILTACISLGAFLAVVYFAWAKLGEFGLASMPFIMMLTSGVVFYYFNTFGKKANSVNYKNCIAYLKGFSLIALYAAGNYYVVNSLNNLLNNLDETHTHVPFGFIFWLWTILIPVVYILLGINKKNSMFLRIGLLLTVATVATIRNYYHLLPIEVVFTLSGIVILAVAYILINYLKTPRNGITYTEPEQAGTLDNINLEGLIIGETTSHLPPAVSQPQTPFGGGSGGGGGSSDSF